MTMISCGRATPFLSVILLLLCPPIDLAPSSAVESSCEPSSSRLRLSGVGSSSSERSTRIGSERTEPVGVGRGLPALLGAGCLELPDALAPGVGAMEGGNATGVRGFAYSFVHSRAVRSCLLRSRTYSFAMEGTARCEFEVGGMDRVLT